MDLLCQLCLSDRWPMFFFPSISNQPCLSGCLCWIHPVLFRGVRTRHQHQPGLRHEGLNISHHRFQIYILLPPLPRPDMPVGESYLTYLSISLKPETQESSLGCLPHLPCFPVDLQNMFGMVMFHERVVYAKQPLNAEGALKPKREADKSSFSV